MGAKLLFLDIETAPILMTSWSMRPPYAGAVWVERDTFILMFSYRWLDEKTVQTVCLPDFPRYKRHKHDDKDICRSLHSLLDEADIVVAHNGDAFDIKKINSRLIVNGFKPPSPYKTIDTLKIARRVFKFDSNKLDNIGRYLGEGRKIPNTGAALWRGCVDGDLKSWATMRRYGKQDTALLANAYDRLRSWAPNHVDIRVYDSISNKQKCPTCASINVQRRGVSVARKHRYARLHCQDCGSWFQGEKAS
jgi:reverse gyrase